MPEWDSPTNKDVLMLVFVEKMNGIMRTAYNWHTMDEKTKQCWRDFAEKFVHSSEDPDWME